MPTKRTPLSRLRKPVITEEMVSLFRTGLEILEQGADQRWEEVGGRRGEYLDLDLRLNIVLLQQAWHAVSVLDHPMPRYMERLASGRDWHVSVARRQALSEELRHRCITKRTNR